MSMKPLSRTMTVVGFILSGTGVSGLAAEGPSPIENATAYWSMADPGTKHALEAHGHVTLGVELMGDERAASLARGGDGRVAQFDGGYLGLVDDAGFAMNPKPWSIAIRLRDPQGTWRYPILGSYSDDKAVSLALRAAEIASRPMEDRNYVGQSLPTIEAWLACPNGPRPSSGKSSYVARRPSPQ